VLGAYAITFALFAVREGNTRKLLAGNP